MDDNRARAFFEDYARFVQIYDHIVAMRHAMERLEWYILIMVVMIGVTLAFTLLVVTIRACYQLVQRALPNDRQRGECGRPSMIRSSVTEYPVVPHQPQIKMMNAQQQDMSLPS